MQETSTTHGTRRRLVPIVSVDVAGYTRLIETDELASHILVQDILSVRAPETMGRFGGVVFKTMGDGLLAEFESVVSAIDWASRFQRDLHESAPHSPEGLPVKLRIGIVLADVLIEGSDRFGEGINLAVRVQSCSPSGGLAVSKWSHDYLTGKLDLHFNDIGSQHLKNISKSVRIYVWHPDPAYQAEIADGNSNGAAPIHMVSQRPSLAVLPFDNMSTDPEQLHFADAVVEELTATLSRINDFFVIARNSAFTYKGTNTDVRRIGQELGVRYLLEGSVRRVGERVRITAQLIEAESAMHIWAGKSEGTTADLFDLQDRLAEMVAGAVYPSVRKAEIERALKKRPDNLEAYDLVMRALPHLWAHRMHENPEAISLLNRALEHDPKYGLAAALCAWAHAQQIAYQWTFDTESERQKGLALIEVAAGTAMEDATGLTALATAVMLLEGNTRRALGFLDKALRLDSNHAWAWMRRGFGLIYTGRPADALESFAKAERLSPLDPFAFNMRIGFGLAYFSQGRYDDAIRYVQMVLDERPGLSWPYRDLAVYRASTGDLAGAVDALSKFTYLRPPMTLSSVSDSLKFMQGSLHDNYIEGLRRAGMT